MGPITFGAGFLITLIAIIHFVFSISKKKKTKTALSIFTVGLYLIFLSIAFSGIDGQPGNPSAAVFAIGAITFLIGIGKLVLALIKQKNKASASYFTSIGLCLLIIGLLISSPHLEDAEANKQETNQTVEENEDKSSRENQESDENNRQDQDELDNDQSLEDEHNDSSELEPDEPPSSGNDEIEEKDKPKQEESKQTNDTKKEDSSTSNFPIATVTRIVDGDTIEINLNGEKESVRLLLVDTPETKHPSLPVQEYGPEASQFAKETLDGKKVKVEYDGPKRDKYDRLLAYLWIGDKIFNQMLLEEGLARYAYVYDPPYTHANEFMKAQNRAKNAGKGIWSIPGYVTADGFNHIEEEQPKSPSDSTKDSTGGAGLKYDPNGPDRDCGDFDTQQEAQAFFEAAGGPEQDPHRLDGSDNDGLVCESL